MLTFPQKIGYFWFRLFDSSGYLFYLLRDRSKFIRMTFYGIYALGFFGLSYFLFHILFVNFFTEYLPELAQFIGESLFLAVFATSLFLPFYEFLYSVNVEEVKQIKKNISAQKAQWWRIRNMRFYTRYFLFSLFWFVGVQFIYWQTLVYLGERHNVSFSLNGGAIKFSSLEEMEIFSNYFLTFLYECVSIWSVFVLLIVVFIEYRTHKLKKSHT